jgi:hypothetical protein
MDLPAMRVVTQAIHDAPRHGVELRAANLPVFLGN